MGIEFLQTLLDDQSSERGYNAICTARSALSSVIILDNNIKFGEHHLVKLFIKGVYNLKPPSPRYLETWDPQIVLNFLKSWAPAHKITLKQLSQKVVMLILLVTGHRGQTILALDAHKMDISASKYTFYLETHDIKQGRPGYKPGPLILCKYPADKRLCVYHYLSKYLERTMELRGNIHKVFITSVKPYKEIARDTVSNWIKDVLCKSGINTNVFRPGSTRSASCSKAMMNGATVDEILRAGGWSSESTFRKWYKRPLQKSKTESLDTFVINQDGKVKS